MVETNEECAKYSKKKRLVFAVVPKARGKRTYYLAADSHDERTEWMDAIRVAISEGATTSSLYKRGKRLFQRLTPKRGFGSTSASPSPTPPPLFGNPSSTSSSGGTRRGHRHDNALDTSSSSLPCAGDDDLSGARPVAGGTQTQFASARSGHRSTGGTSRSSRRWIAPIPELSEPDSFSGLSGSESSESSDGGNNGGGGVGGSISAIGGMTRRAARTSFSKIKQSLQGNVSSEDDE